MWRRGRRRRRRRFNVGVTGCFVSTIEVLIACFTLSGPQLCSTFLHLSHSAFSMLLGYMLQTSRLSEWLLFGIAKRTGSHCLSVFTLSQMLASPNSGVAGEWCSPFHIKSNCAGGEVWYSESFSGLTHRQDPTKGSSNSEKGRHETCWQAREFRMCLHRYPQTW